jgi:deoxyribodipyrimidine photolyase-related protein
MAQFATALRANGHHVLHLKLDETRDYADLPDLIQALCSRHGIEHFDFQLADEYRLRLQLREMQLDDAITVTEFDSEHFLLPEAEFSKFIAAGNHTRL